MGTWVFGVWFNVPNLILGETVDYQTDENPSVQWKYVLQVSEIFEAFIMGCFFVIHLFLQHICCDYLVFWDPNNIEFPCHNNEAS